MTSFGSSSSSGCTEPGARRYVAFSASTGLVTETCAAEPPSGASALPVAGVYWLELVVSYEDREKMSFPDVRELERAWDQHRFTVLPQTFTKRLGKMRYLNSARHMVLRVWVRPDPRIVSHSCEEVCPRSAIIFRNVLVDGTFCMASIRRQIKIACRHARR